jgi:hypothetical protein
MDGHQWWKSAFGGFLLLLEMRFSGNMPVLLSMGSRSAKDGF